jgi:hypothetical protein
MIGARASRRHTRQRRPQSRIPSGLASDWSASWIGRWLKPVRSQGLAVAEGALLPALNFFYRHRKIGASPFSRRRGVGKFPARYPRAVVEVPQAPGSLRFVQPITPSKSERRSSATRAGRLSSAMMGHDPQAHGVRSTRSGWTVRNAALDCDADPREDDPAAERGAPAYDTTVRRDRI